MYLKVIVIKKCLEVVQFGNSSKEVPWKKTIKDYIKNNLDCTKKGIVSMRILRKMTVIHIILIAKKLNVSLKMLLIWTVIIWTFIRTH